MDRNGVVDQNGESWESMSTLWLCQVLWMLGLLWPPVGLVVSRKLSKSYWVPVLQVLWLQLLQPNKRRVHSAGTGTELCRCSVVSCVVSQHSSLGFRQPYWGAAQKILYWLLCYWKDAAPGQYMFERKQLGKAVTVAPSCTYLFICEYDISNSSCLLGNYAPFIFY